MENNSRIITNRNYLTENIDDLFSDNTVVIPSMETMLTILNDYKKEQEFIKLTLDEIKQIKTKHTKFTCSICLKEKTIGKILECNHMFCKRCITTWLSKHVNNCPNCRRKVFIKIPK
jgi:hypothetical protein